MACYYICFVEALFLMQNNVVDEDLQEQDHLIKDHAVSFSVYCV